MRPIHAGNLSGYWILKQGSLNTALVEGTATLLLWQMEGTEEVTIKMVNDCGFAIMAIRSGENKYRLFAFSIDQADTLLPEEYKLSYFNGLIDQKFKEVA